jgi:phosphoglycolate phosphatase-like HAD superfamily hydrolase
VIFSSTAVMKTVMKSRAGNLPPASVKYRLLIFDFDGTIADTLPIIIASFREVASRYRGQPVSAEEVVSHFGLSEEGIIQRLVPSDSDDALREFLALYEQKHDEVALFPGIEQILAMMREQGRQLALVTGKGAVSAEISLRALTIRSKFQWIRTGDPHRDIKADNIKDILELSGIAASDALYIGDAPSDMRAAKEAGVNAVGAAWHADVPMTELETSRPLQIFSSVDVFARWLQNH